MTIYSPKAIPPKNRDKVLMEFEMDAEAIAVASLGQLKVIKVNYRGGGPWTGRSPEASFKNPGVDDGGLHRGT